VGLREIKMERTRQVIAEKAFELFTGQGFERTTIEQIAAAAEVGPRTLYRYFPTKETLIVKFVEVHLFGALVDSVIATTTANAERVLAVYELAARTPSVQAQFSNLWWTWRKAVAAEVARRHKGRSSDLAGNLAAALTMVVIDTSVRNWAESGGRANMRRLVNRALDMMRAGDVPIAAPAVKS
jgi:AcrR family transcriptional regulator